MDLNVKDWKGSRQQRDQLRSAAILLCSKHVATTAAGVKLSDTTRSVSVYLGVDLL